MNAVIMSNPDLAEVCFLVAVILFTVAAVVPVARSTVSVYHGTIVAAGLAFLAFGVLAF